MNYSGNYKYSYFIPDLDLEYGKKISKSSIPAIPFSDLFTIVKEKCKVENEERIINIGKEKGKFYFENFYKKTNERWFYNLRLSRRSIVSINRIRSGHTSLNSSLYRHKIVDTDICNKCGKEVDTIEHIFWICKVFNVQRCIMLEKIRKEIKIGPLSVINLLAIGSANTFYSLAEFIDNIECNI